MGFEVIDGALELGGGSSIRDGALVYWRRVSAGWDFDCAIERREFIVSACGRNKSGAAERRRYRGIAAESANATKESQLERQHRRWR
jgi:hypothetical protein